MFVHSETSDWIYNKSLWYIYAKLLPANLMLVYINEMQSVIIGLHETQTKCINLLINGSPHTKITDLHVMKQRSRRAISLSEIFSDMVKIQENRKKNNNTG